jgi:carbon starvation protein CstA
MNSLVLLIMVVVVFAFGYRFYSKLLKLGVFRLGEDYSTPSPERPAEAESGVFSRHLLFGTMCRLSLAPPLPAASFH